MNNTITYDYTNQAYVKDGIYLDCNHPQAGEMTVLGEVFEGCDCFGREHAGEPAHAVYVNQKGQVVFDVQ